MVNGWWLMTFLGEKLYYSQYKWKCFNFQSILLNKNQIQTKTTISENSARRNFVNYQAIIIFRTNQTWLKTEQMLVRVWHYLFIKPHSSYTKRFNLINNIWLIDNKINFHCCTFLHLATIFCVVMRIAVLFV